MGISEESDDKKAPKKKYCCSMDTKHGVNNWILIAALISVANFVIENYLSNGIVKNPMQLTYSFIAFIQENWWLYQILFLSYLLQIFMCFLNEKCLSLGILQERVGMGLHVFNSIFLLNISAFLFTFYKFNPVAAVAVSAHTFHMSVKFWGYAYTNMVHRTKYKKEMSTGTCEANGRTNGKEEAVGAVSYPQNVTLKNAFEFMACTGSCVYSINPLKKKNKNLIKTLMGILKVIGIHYSTAFLMYQYLLPEADKAVSYIDTQQYLKLLGSILRVALPGNLLWILYFYFYCFEFYLPVFGWVWGTEDVNACQDWWNAENTSAFWTKWNYQVHIWFKNCFFVPALLAGYSKRQAAFIVAFVSGIIHEYLICIPCRTGYGLATFAMLAQIPLAQLTSFIAKKYGAKWGNMTMWLCIMSGQTTCAIFMYYNYTKMELASNIK